MTSFSTDLFKAASFPRALRSFVLFGLLLALPFLSGCMDSLASELVGTWAGNLIRIRHWDILPVVEADIGSIEIVPPRVYSQENTQFLLEARVLDNHGKVIAGLFPEIQWNGPSELGFDTPQQGYTGVVTVPLQSWAGPGDLFHEIPETGQGITASLRGHESEPVKVFVTRADFTDLSISELRRISIPHTPKDLVSIVLMDIEVQEAERQDVLIAVAGEAYLEEALAPPPPGGDGPEVAAFSRSGSVDFADLAPGSGATLLVQRAGSTSETDSHIQMNVPAFHQLEILLWGGVTRDTVEVENVLEAHAAVAGGILKRSRAGIEVDWRVVSEDVDLNYHVESPACNLPGDPTPSEWTPPPYDSFLPQPGQVLAVYADKLLGGVRAFACGSDSYRYGVVFLDFDKVAATTLTHELGHVLGMRLQTMEGSGHTYGLPGLDCSNAMWGSDDLDCRSDAERFTVSQVFRMNWDPRSWLHEGSTLSRKECQNPRMGETVCPCVTTDFVWAGLDGQPGVGFCADYQPFLVR